MESRHSHNSEVRALARAKIKQEYAYFLSLYAQLLTDEVVLNRKKNQLQIEIDQALATGDRQTFYTLAKEYRELLR